MLGARILTLLDEFPLDLILLQHLREIGLVLRGWKTRLFRCRSGVLTCGGLRTGDLGGPLGLVTPAGFVVEGGAAFDSLVRSLVVGDVYIGVDFDRLYFRVPRRI